MKPKLLAILFTGILLRAVFLPNTGFEADIAYWKSWSLAASDKGIIWLVLNTNYNYPSGFALVLWLVGKLYTIFADPYNFNQYWQTTNFVYLVLCKLPSVIADFGTAWGIWHILQKQKVFGIPEFTKKHQSLLVALYLLHPVTIFDGSWWGQVDSVGLVFLIWSVIKLFENKIVPASILLTIGFLMKMQLMVFFPIFLVYVLRKRRLYALVKSVAAIVCTFMIVSFPLSFTGHLNWTIKLITRNADWFPVLSLRAFNFWWLFSNAKGLDISDKIIVFGLTTAKNFGLLLFSASYFFACLLTFIKPSRINLLFSFVLAGFAFFLFPTQSHDRYTFPILFLLLIMIPMVYKDKKERKKTIGLFAALSITTLLNINMSMIAEYPKNGIPIVSWINGPSWSILVSIANLVLFGLLIADIINRTYHEARAFTAK